jgi:hypothetical protein
MRSPLKPLGARRQYSARKRLFALGGCFALACVAAFACSKPLDGGADERPGFDLSPPEGPTFGEPDAGPVQDADTPMCISYECPAPYATCIDKPGLCTTNLKTDLYNCGACGKRCELSDGGILPSGVSFSCIDGECHLECPVSPVFLGNCNGQLEDGCEVALDTDPANCGACGNACKEGEVCWRAACGCPPGYTQCGGECTQLDRDPKNCSACGRECALSDVDAGAWPCADGGLPPHYGPICAGSSCAIGCGDGFGDCNADTCGDGCETYLGNDPKNCGACGHACLPEQACIMGKCECENPALSLCNGACVDLMKNEVACGSCGNVCPGYRDFFDRQRGKPTCELGRCSYYCPPGRADCDDRIDNGCEVDLMVDPRNCGGCGVHCDLESGQPCAAGRCLTKPCDVPDAGGPF